MKRFILIISVIIISVLTTRAQNIPLTPDTINYRLPQDVVVTAPRVNLSLKQIPFSTAIVDRYTLNTIPRFVSIDEALKAVPGIKIDNQANGNRLHMSIRGIGILTERGIRGIKILMDEIPINDPTGFAPDFFDVDLTDVERIEVLRGPAASLYGGSASGGIVNVISKNSPDIPLFGEAGGFFGSNNFWKGYGQFGGKARDINYRVSFGRTMGDGYRQHTHFWGNNLYAKASYVPTSKIKLTPIFEYVNFYHENPEGINLQRYNEDPKQPNPDAIPFNEYLQTERNTAGLTGLLIFDEHEIQFNTYNKSSHFTEANNHTFNYRTYMTPGASVQYSFNYGKQDDFFRNKISAGTDLQWQTIDEHRVVNDHSVPGTDILSKEEINQNGTGLFLLDNISLGGKTNIFLSIRYDKIHNELKDLLKQAYDLSGTADFSKTTGRVGISYSLMDEANIYANWGQGFLPPATEELAQNPDHFGGFNTHLVSATSNDYEIGCRGYAANSFYYDFTGFYLLTKNDFDRYRITDSLRTQETFYRNVGSSERMGLELYSRYNPVNDLTIQLAYTYSHFIYTNNDPIKIIMDDPTVIKYIKNGNYLPNSPQHQFYIDAEYHLPYDFIVGVNAETLSKTYIDGANIESEAAAGYTLIGARIGYNLNINGLNAMITIQGRNLGGQKYVAFTEPDPGGNSYQPGAGREFFGSIRLML
ncbi:MAG TPA: TonB-dependent receptor [Ignavibacteriaceae bacterium]|nr:TonB-dependent receptor [Ignavibacteriaceae bacterium]